MERMSLFAAFFLFFLSVSAGAVSDTVPQFSPDTAKVLDEVIVSASSQRMIQKIDGGKLTLDVDALGNVIRSFGEADPINYVKMIGGVSSTGDYSSGIAINGANFSQSVFRVGEATVFFPYHFGGIFSMFNSIHYPRVSVAKGNHDASLPSRLGASVEIKSREYHPDRLHAVANVGMTASALGLRIPLSKRFSVDISGRLSYIDRLYGPLLEMGDQKIQYSFGETALTARWDVSDCDRIKLDVVYNSDRLYVLDRHYDLDTHLKWGNFAASLVYRHQCGVPFKIWATWSGFRNTLDAFMPALSIEVPSAISEVKAGGEIEMPCFGGGAVVKTGFEASAYKARPQEVAGTSTRIRAYELRPYVSWTWRLDDHFDLDAGLRVPYYHSRGYDIIQPAPSFSFGYKDDVNHAALHLAVSPQFIHQTGLADVGLSSNFWFPATASSPRELAVGGSLSLSRTFFDGLLSIELSPYYRRILHEPEYAGILLDLIERDYSLDGHLMHSNGFNAGFDLSANFKSGQLSAIANYSLGYARRKFPSSPERYLPALSEGLHNFNVMASYAIGGAWNVGANFMLASGRCYTPVEALYMLGDNLMMVLGPRNSGRMPLYHRLDLSGSYHFTTGRRTPLSHTIVLSLINAYGHRNIELSTYRYSSEDGTFYRHDVASLYRFLPSLSYTIEF